jgi:hypothetical protein
MSTFEAVGLYPQPPAASRPPQGAHALAKVLIYAKHEHLQAYQGNSPEIVSTFRRINKTFEGK